MDILLSHLVEQTISTRQHAVVSSQLRQDLASEDDFRQMVALQCLCNQLNMSTSLSLTAIDTNGIVPLVLKCMQKTSNSELALLAARALTYMADSLPQTLGILSTNENVNILLQHLRQIQDMELSDQCLTCLEKLCQVSFGAIAVFRNNGVEDMLSFIDFFTISSQRKIWAAIARMLRFITVSNYSHLKNVLPTIHFNTSHNDPKIRAKALATLFRAILGVCENAAMVEEIFGDLAVSLSGILAKPSHDDAALSTSLSLILAATTYSPTVTRSIIESGAFQQLVGLLDASTALPAVGEINGPRLGGNSTISQPADDAASLPQRSNTLMSSRSTVAASTTAGAAHANRAAHHFRLSFDQTQEICGILAACLVPCRVEYLMHLEELAQLEMSCLAHPLAGTPTHHEALSEEEEEEGGLESDAEGINGASRDNERRGGLAETRTRISQSDDIELYTNLDYSSCRIGFHSCDACGKRCFPGDWYRCNECRDCDYCAGCLLKLAKNHNEGQHSFTDMIFRQQLMTASALIKPVRNAAETEKQRSDMYEQSPKLFETVLSAVPSVVRLCAESEALKIQISAMNFLLSVATMASREQLGSSDFCNAAMCEVLDAVLRDSHMLLNAMGIVLLQILFKKMTKSIRTLFVREGVSHALFLFKKKCLHFGTQTPSDNNPLPPAEKNMHTLQGWLDVLSEEASRLLALFPKSDERDVGTQQLEKIVSCLQSNDLEHATHLLRKSLLARLTPYELLSHDIAHELRAAMVRCGDVKRIISLAHALSEAAPGAQSPHSPCFENAPSPLTRLVRCLQTVLSRLDNFEQPDIGFALNFQSHIILHLVPHSGKKPPGTDLKKLERRKPLITAREQQRESSLQGEPSVVFARQGGHGSIANAHTAASGQWSFVIGIDPFASVDAIIDFLSGKIFANRCRRQRSCMENNGWVGSGSSGDDGRIEEVVSDPNETQVNSTSAPTLPSGQAHRSRKNKAPRPTLWVRYQKHVLPPSMTILQIVQQSVKSGVRSGKKQRRKNLNNVVQLEDSLSHGLWPDTPKKGTITLHYSTEPFGLGYEMLSNYCDLPGVSPSTIYLPSQESRPAAALRLLERINASFPYSKGLLTEAQMDVLSVLGTFYEFVSNRAALLQYCGQKAGGIGNGREGNPLESVSVSTTTQNDFIHYKLDNKALCHCSKELLAGQQASTWGVRLALDCNFLFTPSTRKFFFQVSFCDTNRSLARLQQANLAFGANNSNHTRNGQTRMVQLMKEKKGVLREYPLWSAMELLDESNRPSGSSAWEFNFYGEEGSGTGPTREFYTLVSTALRERKLNLWLPSDEGQEDTHFSPSNGLYPRLLSVADTSDNAKNMIHKHFHFIGRFSARAILDDHVISLPLSHILIKLLRGDACGVDDMKAINESVGDILLAMTRAHRERSGVVCLPGHPEGVSVESMDLVFSSPGDETELVDGGSSVQVTTGNMIKYCDAVTQFWLKTGVEAAVSAMRKGFHDYIPLVALRMLTVEEIYDIINGDTAPTTREEFEENCLADHGYTLTCKHVQWLFDILASFSLIEQRKFFTFLTGSPHLPVGGLSNLKPRLTIVRKTSSDAAVKEGDQLPSAMTCQNYLKLPAYDTREQMERKLLQAINEGVGAFLLT